MNQCNWFLKVCEISDSYLLRWLNDNNILKKQDKGVIKGIIDQNNITKEVWIVWEREKKAAMFNVYVHTATSDIHKIKKIRRFIWFCKKKDYKYQGKAYFFLFKICNLCNIQQISFKWTLLLWFAPCKKGNKWPKKNISENEKKLYT